MMKNNKPSEMRNIPTLYYIGMYYVLYVSRRPDSDIGYTFQRIKRDGEKVCQFVCLPACLLLNLRVP